ncbi:MAG TPA: hypothetical protein VMM14_00140 [Acidimicrobiia bacterium]|nr:hypothetical protein [Acidimicrobiia bacterium]
MKAFRILQAAMMVQILLGLWRFVTPYLGWSVDGRVWQVHPLLGIGIAVAALILFRPRNSVASSPSWTAARYVALVPLALGLAMRYGVVNGLTPRLVHMVVGLTALGLMDSAIKREFSRRSDAASEAQRPSDAAPASA